MSSYLITAVYLFSRVMEFLIFGRVILSWIPLSPDNPFKILIYNLTEPILGPIRHMIEKSIFGGKQMMLDFSPIIALILVQVITSILINILS